MSAASYNRGSRVIREGIRLDANDHASLHHMWSQERAELQAEIASLRQDLDRAKLRIAERASTLTAERIEHASAIAKLHDQMMEQFRRAERMQAHWRWVSRIVRAYVTPAQVQEFRDENR